MNSIVGICADCDMEVSLPEHAKEGQIVTCTECGTMLMIVDIVGRQATLDYADEESEI